MRVVIYILFFFTIVSAFFVQSVSANTLNNTPERTLKYSPSGSNSWFPYYIKNSIRKGIVPDLIELILARAELTGQEVLLPPARTNLALINGEIDFDFINPQWLPAREKSTEFVFSEPIIPIVESFISAATTDIGQLKKLMQQSAKTEIGTVLGYYYYDDDTFKRVDFSSEKSIIKALKLNRVTYAICDNITAKYWSTQLEVPLAFGDVHSDGFLHLRLRSAYRYLLPKINKAIAELKTEKVIEQVIETYL